MGERIFNLQRMFNVMAGFDRTHDILPERFFAETLKEGPPKDKVMPRQEFEKALDEYYALRGWDAQGRPTLEKLASLEIESPFIETYRKFLKADDPTMKT
jgi:aldehyde:ferredoxin oxidoreductase